MAAKKNNGIANENAVAIETYRLAAVRILQELAELGWKVTVYNRSTGKPIKVPHATHPNGTRVFFKPQSLYLNGYSLWIDRRGMTGKRLEDIVIRKVGLMPGEVSKNGF